MSLKRSIWNRALAATLGAVIAGCGGPAPTPTTTDTRTSAGAEHEHAHSAHGPHGGDLVELGDEEYHAEIVHETDGQLSVYVLDGTAKNAVPIDATEIVLNVTHEGTAEQFTLAAAPTESDPAGQSSRFTSTEGHAGADLDREGVEARLAVTINGASYQGAVAHEHGDHAHNGHDHQ